LGGDKVQSEPWRMAYMYLKQHKIAATNKLQYGRDDVALYLALYYLFGHNYLHTLKTNNRGVNHMLSVEY
jgi:hypothetical protein